MVKMIVFLSLLMLALVDIAWTQDKAAPVSRMEVRADSVSMMTDSLISSQKLLHIVFKSKYAGDTTTYYRHYYVDTVNRYLVKCILDTIFTDEYKQKFTQSVIYFNLGYEYQTCYNEKRGTNSDFCSFSNIYPEENETKLQTGKLNKNWSREALDEKMRYHVRDEIDFMKFMQRKNYN